MSISLPKLAWYGAALSMSLAMSAMAVHAENIALEPKSDAEWQRVANDGTVRILTKGLGCTCTVIASDMAGVLNETGQLRILPVIGHGSLQGIADIMYLRGIDLSILQADVLAYVQRNNIHRDIEKRVRYVTKLYNSELHLIAGPESRTIQDLDGKLVSYDVKGRGSFITAENVFQSLGIEVQPVHLERDVAIEQLRNGEIAAAFVVTGKPADSMRNVEPGDGLHFLPVPITDDLAETYLPSSLSHEDYPKLIEDDEIIETIAVPEVLAVYNWTPNNQRYGKVKAVVEAFFENFEKFDDKVRHPKWQDVDLTADLPGWQRFKPAQDWLEQNQLLSSNNGEREDDGNVGDSYDLKVDNNVVRERDEEVEKAQEKAENETRAAAVEDNAEIYYSLAYPTNKGAAVARKIASTPLQIGVEPASSSEGDESLNFSITLSRPTNDEIPVIFNTIEGTAKANVDFRKHNGIMIIEPGVTRANLEISMVDDQIREGDEDFSLILTVDPAIAELEAGPFIATIRDND